MSLRFALIGNPAQIVFGPGARVRVGELLDSFGRKRALVLSTPQQTDMADEVVKTLGGRAAGTFAKAAMHTPVEISEEAVAAAEKVRADCLVAVGGGSTTGLGKAVALRTGLMQIVIATTYAGSEVTDILGQTEKGAKTTLRDRKILPNAVIYDPELTTGLPVSLSVTSALNAMAHAAEGLYASNRNPVASLMAGEGLRALHHALPGIVANPADIDARSEALYGAWLCGTVLGSVAMALHHKLCHVLGGSFDLPHAETHAVLLPHTIGFNALAAADELKPLTAIVGAPAGAGLFDFARTVGAPASLRELGFKESDVDRAAKIATANPYENPRPFDEADIRKLLKTAWAGDRPGN